MAGGALDKLLTACAAVERDPATMWKSAQALVFPTDDSSVVASIRDSDMGPRSIAGSSQDMIDTIGEYADLGFDEFIVPDFTLGNDASERLERYQQFNTEVAPHFM